MQWYDDQAKYHPNWNVLDNYEGTGEYFILYFDKKIEEYNKLLK